MPHNVARKIREVLALENLAVLNTVGEDGPHASLVGFLATSNLKNLVFPTMKDTRKYRNLADSPAVALLMDNRSHTRHDFTEATAITATGTARELGGAELDEVLDGFLNRHPYMKAFVTRNQCALFLVKVDCYRVVNGLDGVTEFRP